MKETTLTILENTPLTHDTYRLRLAGDTSAITAPGAKAVMAAVPRPRTL